MTDAREKAVERLAKRFYDAIMADQFSQWPPFENASAATKEDALAAAQAAFRDLGLIAIDPALVEAVERQRARHEAGECNEYVVTEAERALAHAVLAQVQQ